MGNFKSELKGLNRFQPIPRDLIQDCELSAQARFIYSYMAAKPEDWEFWQEVMCREVGMSVATLRKYLYELRDAGWLEIGSQKGQGTGRFGAIQYTLKAVCNNVTAGENLPYDKNPVAQNLAYGKNCATQNLSHINNIDTENNTDSIKKTKSKEPATLLLPFSSDKFRETWEALIEEKEWKKKSHNALRLALKDLGKYDEEFAIELMEKTIKNGWKGVVFADTDQKFQEWKSARQQAIDNAQPRTAVAQRAKVLPQNNQIDEFYRKQKEKEEKEREEQLAQLKAKYGFSD